MATLVAIQYDDPHKAQDVRLSLVKLEREYLIEPGSSLKLDGLEIEDFQEGVKELLYGAEYGRESN